MGVEELTIVNKNLNKKSRFYKGFFNKKDQFKTGVNNVLFSHSSKEAAQEILSKSPEIVNFVGGDGTFSDTLNEVLKVDADFLESTAIKITPFGSGNDKYNFLLECVNGSRNIRDDFLEVVINDEYKRFVFNVGGMGLDAQSILEYNDLSRNMNASMRYLVASARAVHKLNGYHGLLKYSAKSVLKDDFISVESDVIKPVMFLFMVGKYFGSGMPINDNVVFDDGKFESLYLKRGSNQALYKSLASLSLFKKSQYDNDLTSYFNQPLKELNLSVLSVDDFYFQSDGEILKNEVGVPISVKELSVKPAGKINYLV